MPSAFGITMAGSGTTHIAATVSLADVTTAMGLCSDGDTLSIPGGTASWPDYLTITKAIWIVGAGKTSTIITGYGPLFQPGSNKAQRVSHIGFAGGQIKIRGSTNGSYVLDQIRIDHTDHIGGVNCIQVEGWVEGLIDHNTFLNGNVDILIVGDNDYAWTRPIQAGTSHALFIEDNTFTQTNAGGGSLNENVYHQEGTKTVIRYNTFDASAYTSYDACLCDIHGNQAYYPGGGIRGQTVIEIYNNTFLFHHTYRLWYVRSGSIISHDNVYTHPGSGLIFRLDEAESHETGRFSPLRTAWPAQDQIFNSFFWNEYDNSNLLEFSDLSMEGDTAIFVQENRDVFMHPPASSGGYESFTGSRNGGSQTAPTQSDTGSMIFTAGANAYYPYTPYAYPHPLQGAG